VPVGARDLIRAGAASGWSCASRGRAAEVVAGGPWRAPAAAGRLVFVSSKLTRITFDPQVMGGKPCIRGLRVTVGTIVGLLAAGRSAEEILRAYPYLEPEDIAEALAYAAWRSQERDLPFPQG